MKEKKVRIPIRIQVRFCDVFGIIGDPFCSQKRLQILVVFVMKKLHHKGGPEGGKSTEGGDPGDSVKDTFGFANEAPV